MILARTPTHNHVTRPSGRTTRVRRWTPQIIDLALTLAFGVAAIAGMVEIAKWGLSALADGRIW